MSYHNYYNLTKKEKYLGCEASGESRVELGPLVESYQVKESLNSSQLICIMISGE